MQSAATRRGVASSLSMMKTYWAAVGVTIVALASFVTVVTAMATRLTPAVEGKDGGSFSLFKRMMNMNEYGPTNGKPTAAVTSLQKDLVIVFDLIFAKGTLLGQVSDIFMQRSNDLHDFLEKAWNHMANSFSPFVICGPITFLYHETVYFACYIPWLIMDNIPSMRKYKIQPDKNNDAPQQIRCLRQLLFSHIVVQFPMMLTFHFVVDLFGFKIAGPLPPFSDLAWQIPVFLVIEDFYFYWVHRFLHWKRIYKYIHKVHHEHKAPFGITAEYAHPLETVFLGIGTLLGPILFCRHLFTLWVYLAVRLWETVEDHSGYDVWFNPTNLIPFWGGPVHHDFHHKMFDGPYSSIFTYCDWIFGTDRRWREHQKKLRPGGNESIFYPAVFRGEPNMKNIKAD